MNKELLLFYDLCGFRNCVLKNGSQKAFEILTPFLTSAIYSNDVAKSCFSILVMSDSVLVQPKAEVEEKFLKLIEFACSVSFSVWNKFTLGNPDNTPIKGSIGYDDLMFGKTDVSTQAFMRPQIIAKDMQIVIGRALIKCYDWEKDQDWYCISIYPDDISDLRKDYKEQFNRLLNANYLIEYPVPVKNGKSIVSYVINNYFAWGADDLKLTFLEHISSTSDNSIRRKYQNTIDFFNYIYDNKLFKKKL